jgi:hypothetical protein
VTEHLALARVDEPIWLAYTVKEILAKVSKSAGQSKILDTYQSHVLAEQCEARELSGTK